MVRFLDKDFWLFTLLPCIGVFTFLLLAETLVAAQRGF